MRETLEEQLARNQVEAKRLWAEMETATSDKHRYGLAWGAMDCELACTLIAEELANMIQEKAT